MLSGCSIVPSGTVTALWVFDDLVEIKLDGDETGGAYSVLEDWPAPSFSPALHVHVDSDEIVQIVEGTFRLLTTDGERALAAGDIVRIPKGTAHALANTGDTAGHRLVTFVPAGPERLWAEVGVPAVDRTVPPRGPTDPRAFFEAARRHGLKVLRSQG